MYTLFRCIPTKTLARESSRLVAMRSIVHAIRERPVFAGSRGTTNEGETHDGAVFVARTAVVVWRNRETKKSLVAGSPWHEGTLERRNVVVVPGGGCTGEAVECNDAAGGVDQATKERERTMQSGLPTCASVCVRVKERRGVWGEERWPSQRRGGKVNAPQGNATRCAPRQAIRSLRQSAFYCTLQSRRCPGY